jgi:hypothetical protein
MKRREIEEFFRIGDRIIRSAGEFEAQTLLYAALLDSLYGRWR